MIFLDPQCLKALRRRRPRSGYHHAHPRTLQTQVRRYHIVQYLRNKYHLSENRLTQIIGGSSRTIHQDVKAGVYTIQRLRWQDRRSKISQGIHNDKGGFISWNGLKKRVRDYILGAISTVFEILGDDPP